MVTSEIVVDVRRMRPRFTRRPTCRSLKNSGTKRTRTSHFTELSELYRSAIAEYKKIRLDRQPHKVPLRLCAALNLTETRNVGHCPT